MQVTVVDGKNYVHWSIFNLIFFAAIIKILYKTGILIDRPIILQLINNYYRAQFFRHIINSTSFTTAEMSHFLPIIFHWRHTICAASLLFFQLDPFFFAYGDKDKPILIFKQCLFSILA